VFVNTVDGLHMNIGDLTNDGAIDLVITKGGEGNMAGAAVFQRSGGDWDDGTLLQGPTLNSAKHPIIAPIRNDGQNWFVYTEHCIGNGCEYLRAHRYSGITLVENRNIASRRGHPGWMAANVADLNRDDNLEIWYDEIYSNSHHLFRREWDPATNSYPGFELKYGGFTYGPYIRPKVGDFLGNNTQSLIWVSRNDQVDLVTYTPGSGVQDHTSTLIFNSPGWIYDIDAGEFDGLPGTDFVVIAYIGSTGEVYLISGGTFMMTKIASGISEHFDVIRAGDLDGDGIDEIYAAGYDGGIYGYDSSSGWRQIAVHTDAKWFDGEKVRWDGATRDEVLFGGALGGRNIRVVSLTAEAVNNSPIADAGGPYVISADSSMQFDGTGTDPDQDSLTYSWTATAGSFDDASLKDPMYTAPSEAGIYEVSLTVTDPGGLSDQDTTMAIVYNPDGGFVTGGGWIWSPPNAYAADPDLEGKANFGFVSKYKKGASVPTGNTEFQFHTADLNFHSSSYDWLVVTGSDNAKFKGTGTINGEGDYKFMLWAGDKEPDTFRIRIWSEDAFGVETDVYDNGFDQPIGGGSIVIHTKNK
jgi:hypothetical protein